jgi:hypothetical protein
MKWKVFELIFLFFLFMQSDQLLQEFKKTKTEEKLERTAGLVLKK